MFLIKLVLAAQVYPNQLKMRVKAKYNTLLRGAFSKNKVIACC